MTKKNDLVLVDDKYLKDKIYIIRGQKVILDRDLAEIYGYTTKVFNRQVQRNIEKFEGDDFMFQLTRGEIDNLVRSQIVTSPNIPIFKEYYEGDSVRCQIGTSPNNTYFKGQDGGTRYLPYAFTEQGIYMLMTVLKGPLAIKQSRALIRLFKSMKDFLIENRGLISNKELELRTQLLEIDVKDIKEDNKEIKMDLKKVMDNFKDPSAYKHFLILDGKKLEADIAYKNIFKQAKSSIIYIDNYIGLKNLELLSYSNKGVSITIFSDNKSKPSLTESMIADFNTQNKTNKLSLYKPSIKFHDRYIVIDHNTKNEAIYHCGASLKDSGNNISTITKLEMPILYKSIIDDLVNKSI